ncbi:MAG: DUF6351 family protein [Acidimicrobiales bacterium]|nr:DUF6351 family protein [Acidimicrobiales bacterium]
MIAALAVALVASTAAVSTSGAAPPTRALTISVLSSAPEHVSGGDSLLQIDVPRQVPLHQVTVLAGDRDVSASFEPHPTERALVGVVDGLPLGPSEIVALPNGRGRGRPDPGRVTLVNHPRGGPIFSGPQQQPFVCTTARASFAGRRLLGQPIADNQDGIGIPVAAEAPDGSYPSDDRGYPTDDAEILGWSKDCAAETKTGFLYKDTGGSFRWLDDPATLPADVAQTTTLDGQTVPYVVRWERGTINRFPYSIAMLVPAGPAAASDDSLWNDRLVFSLQGGVAIGHTQGTLSSGAMLYEPVLGQGYAVVNSTGLRTNTHYNLQLGGETALMLKEHFIEQHGVPRYTVGVGGSGGAIQQYVYAQNHPGLLDAAIPQYSYPDMVTQTIDTGDCELLEHYFDVTDGDNPKWRDPEMRQAIQGLNASDHPKNLSSGEVDQWNLLYFAYGLLGLPVMDRAADSPAPALTECRAAWFGLTPLVMNPTFTNVDDLDELAQGADGVEWTHWADLVNIYGTDDTGFARVPWDNVGVQYGLEALRSGLITPEEFLHLNANVGSWKDSNEMVTEGFPFVGDVDLADFDPWSSRQMHLSPDGGTTPAPRRTGDPAAIDAAHQSGMVFSGDVDIPIIDWRHYLENELDMHHSHESFGARQRILDARGSADNHVVWFTDARPAVAFDQTPMAFEVIDQWMANIEAHPERSVGANRPATAVDSCFATDGSLIASGEEVWNGILDEGPAGTCTEQFPVYSTSRMVAGGGWNDSVFACPLQPVVAAIDAGSYGPWEPTPDQIARLEEIFPTGVCDNGT